MRLLLCLPLLALAPAPPIAPGTSGRELVTFETTHAALPGEALFLLGDLFELGGGDLRRALPMTTEDGVEWRVTVALPAQRTYRYAFWTREDDVLSIARATNGAQVSAEFTAVTGASPGPGPVRSVEALTTLVDPVLRWRAADRKGPFHAKPMRRVGAGRAAGEERWTATVATPRGAFQYFLEGADGGREPATGVRHTELSEVFLQDGEVFSYRPAEVVSPQRRALPLVQTIHSDLLGANRTFRVMLPRGYDEHTDRAYPVLYQYDGQVAWDGPNAYDRGGRRLSNLVSSGSAGELIVVAIDAGGACGRPRDTIPADDLFRSFCTLRGQAQTFLAFVLSELKPHVDATWRTRPERETTFLSGFSLGGLLAWVAAYDLDWGFGGVAAQSPSLWAAPAFMGRTQGLVPGVRVYLDFGDVEPTIAPDGWAAGRRLAGLGAALGEDLHLHLAFRQTHTFQNAGRRLGQALRFLWPATAEADALARANGAPGRGNRR